MFNCESFDNIIDYPPNEFCRLALIIPVPSSGNFWELFSLGQALVGPRSATTWCDIRMGMNRVTIRLAPIGLEPDKRWLRLFKPRFNSHPEVIAKFECRS